MDYRTARALFPHRPDVWGPEFLYEPLGYPDDHPELALFSSAPTSLIGLPEQSTPSADESATPAAPEALQARMLNEFVYCPRLFFYEHIEGIFVESADTERGKALHKKVDRGHGDLPNPQPSPAIQPDPDAEGGQPAADTATSSAKIETKPDIIHSRSAMLGSDRLGVVAKLDLIEASMTSIIPDAPAKSASTDDLFGMASGKPKRSRVVQSVTPVDYKAGAPKPGDDRNELWDADKMQLGLQMLVLRDNGYVCDEGVIYYRATKQRVRLPMTPELEAWIIAKIAEARQLVSTRQMPPPLVSSPKCVRCSLAPVCLPDETAALRRRVGFMSPDGQPQSIAPREKLTIGTDESPSLPRVVTNLSSTQARDNVRRLLAARDDTRALYLNTPGIRIGKTGEVLTVKDGDRTIETVRMMDVSHIGLFGNIQISSQALHELCEADIPVAYFSMGGWFYGITHGHGLKNIFTRIEQFRQARIPHTALDLARRFIHGKIRNQRTLLMRLHIDPPESVVGRLKRFALDALNAASQESLLGIEGSAAALYFQNFAGMIKQRDITDVEDEIPGLEDADRSARQRVEREAKFANDFRFDFTKRTRRPPTDPVNALLSLAYSLLAKDCTIACYTVGFDPYLGLYHQPRHGRPAMALDLMEEFRPLIAESTVLTAINNRMIGPEHFVRAGDAVNLSTAGRKAFFQAYEQRINSLITHPIFDYKVSYRRIIELQARLLARHLTGEIPEYIPMMTR